MEEGSYNKMEFSPTAFCDIDETETDTYDVFRRFLDTQRDSALLRLLNGLVWV